jgi:hypothetical protein
MQRNKMLLETKRKIIFFFNPGTMDLDQLCSRCYTANLGRLKMRECVVLSWNQSKSPKAQTAVSLVSLDDRKQFHSILPSNFQKRLFWNCNVFWLSTWELKFGSWDPWLEVRNFSINQDNLATKCLTLVSAIRIGHVRARLKNLWKELESHGNLRL